MSRIVVESKKPVWMVLAVALVIHTGLISLQGRRRIDTSFIRIWILDSLAPMEKLVDRSSHSVVSVWDGYVWLVGTKDQNQRLKNENDGLRMQLASEHEAVLEAERVRALVGLQEAGIGKTIVARVIGRDAGRSQTVTIDKGRAHGVKPDSAVVTADGIVGRVIQSSNFFSIVQLMIDSQSAAGVMLESTRRQGIVKGNGGRELDLDFIDDDNDLKPGDKFLSSGMDKIYPKGLPVGTIIAVSDRRVGGLIKAVQVRPAVDLGRLEDVLVVTQRTENVDVTDFTGPIAP
jgi:rod shape-determining protein MreC